MRIDVLQRHVVEWAGIDLGQVIERALGIGPLIGKHRWVVNRSLLPGGTQLADAVFEHCFVERRCNFLSLAGIWLEKAGIQVIIQWNVQPIHPDRWLIYFTPVIVPEPGRS